MRRAYTVTHAPTGRSVTVKAYSAEEAHRKGLAQLQKVVGLASVPGHPAPQSPAPPAHANNTAVAADGKSVKSKLTTAPKK